MDGTQQRYQSRTIWSQVIAGICFILYATGVVHLSDGTQNALVDGVVNLAGVVSQILAIYFRVKSELKIAPVDQPQL